MILSNLVGRCFAPSPTGTEWGTQALQCLPPDPLTGRRAIQFLADCEDTSASREQTAPPEAVVSQERHPNPAPIPPARVPAPMPGAAAEAEQNPPFF